MLKVLKIYIHPFHYIVAFILVIITFPPILLSHSDIKINPGSVTYCCYFSSAYLLKRKTPLDPRDINLSSVIKCGKMKRNLYRSFQRRIWEDEAFQKKKKNDMPSNLFAVTDYFGLCYIE